MSPRHSSLLALLLGSLALAAACGARPRPPQPPAPAVGFQSASLAQLVAGYNQNAAAIHTMALKLNLSATVGKKSYPSVTAFLLTQKPASIRIWGTFTLVGRLFDMASDGASFQLSLPTRNQFIVGQNNFVPDHTANPLEKLRPQVILSALLIHAIPASERYALDPDSGPTEYDVLVLQPQADGSERLLRRITFSRVDLLPHRQVIYDSDGVHQTRATYNRYTLRGTIPVPEDITIERPTEGYTLRLRLAPDGITLNAPMAGNPFQLQPPVGSTVIQLGADHPGATPISQLPTPSPTARRAGSARPRP